VFWGQRRLLGATSFTTVTGKGDGGVPMPLPEGWRRAASLVVVPWLAFTLVVYLFAFAGGFVQTWGRDYTPTLRHFVTAFDIQRGNADVGAALVFAGTAWNSLFTTLKLSAIAAPLCAVLRPRHRLAARADDVPRPRRVRVRRLARVRDSGHRPRRELHPRLQRAAVRADRHRPDHRPLLRLPEPASRRPRRQRVVSPDRPLARRGVDDASRRHRDDAAPCHRAAAPPALVAALVYSFVRSMTTVSAVVFLVTAETELATTYIIGRVGNGDYGVALAYCTVLIALMSIAGRADPVERRRADDRPARIGAGAGMTATGSPTAAGALDERSGIELRSVSKRYGGDVSAPLVVDAVSFSVARGSLTTLLGPSGCGKTTTLRMIAGLEAPTSGRVVIAGRDVTGLPAAERDVSMVFQSYALFPHMSVLANVAYGSTSPACRERRRASARAPRWRRSAWSISTSGCRASSRAASSSASRWRARSSSSRRCCSSTSRSRTSTHACADRCARRSAPCSSVSA
jgi:ABC-type multidrug transport system fused ATPase/permease subunit